MGLAQIRGREEIATSHLMRVTRMNRNQAEDHKKKAFSIWRERNKFEWNLDISIITSSGINLARNYSKYQRKTISDTQAKHILAENNIS